MAINLSDFFKPENPLAKTAAASQMAGQKLSTVQQRPPYEKKSTGQRVMEGVIGGATAGLSAANLMGGAAKQPGPEAPGGFSNPDGSVGVNSRLGSDGTMPGATFGSQISDFFKFW